MVVKKQQDPINQMVRQSENAIYFSLPNTLNYTKNKNKLYQTNFIKLWQNHILHTKPNIELKRKKILY